MKYKSKDQAEVEIVAKVIDVVEDLFDNFGKIQREMVFERMCEIIRAHGIKRDFSFYWWQTHSPFCPYEIKRLSHLSSKSSSEKI